MEKNKTLSHSSRRKKYNSDKISVQILKSTHKKLKEYCVKNDIIMKDFLNEIILKNV
tara:strand:+ start:9250 stop:9420 length:171 start_codon:yes stop_codon:yes gene_type:complete